MSQRYQVFNVYSLLLGQHMLNKYKHLEITSEQSKPSHAWFRGCIFTKQSSGQSDSGCYCVFNIYLQGITYCSSRIKYKCKLFIHLLQFPWNKYMNKQCITMLEIKNQSSILICIQLIKYKCRQNITEWF